MIRMRVFGRCAIYNDPISPVIKNPTIIGWNALYRDIDLTIERRWNGAELLRRMKGWFTANPERMIDVIELHALLQVSTDGDLIVELEDEVHLHRLKSHLEAVFGDQVLLKP